jgi:DNA-binding CsgD family transcriptional regulator/pimeloyl-ACP methyl ester carboxylesterase
VVGRDLADVGAALLAALSAGQPGAAIVDAWPLMGDADPRWQTLVGEIATAAGRLHPSVGEAALIHPEAAGAALVDRRCRLRQADARFREWIGEPAASADCRRLVAQALAGGPAIGLVTTLDGRVAPVFARPATADGPWAPIAAALGDPAAAGDNVLLIAFAPSKSSALAGRASAALGLTPLEAKVAEALLDAPNLAVAADAIGVGRETAKDALARAMKKTGVRRASELVGRLVDLTFEAGRDSGENLSLLRQALGLSPAEARVAAALAAGVGEAREIGARLGLSEETVKSYRRSIYAKTGASHARDLLRLISEVVELDRLASVAEVRPDQPGVQERLRVIVVDGRRVAFIDYGPASGAPLLFGHGFSTGRLMPKPLLDTCQRAGMRVIVPQRPGFGLTEPAVGDYLETAAGDLAAILDSLGYEQAKGFYRDGGVSTLITFAQRFPGRLQRGVLFNPRTPKWARPPPAAPMSAISRLLLDHPALIEPFAQMLRHQTRSDPLAAMLRRACSGCEADRVLIEDEAVMRHIVRDAQGLMARSVRGFVDEHRVYTAGWSPPGLMPDSAWTIAWSGALVPDPDVRPWSGLPNLRVEILEGAGGLVAFSHPELLVSLLG